MWLGWLAAITFALAWTAPGDDGAVGSATAYVMRWSALKPDTSSAATLAGWWNVATPVAGLPSPELAGTQQSAAVTAAFQAGRTYYFVIAAVDDAGNWSKLSNVASASTIDSIGPQRVTTLRRVP